ncbi:MAG TPA: VWA domain-containing protein [Terriglobia bacterium]|nr:VWA domain-containing protein [Terriglobia bacterium]
MRMKFAFVVFFALFTAEAAQQPVQQALLSNETLSVNVDRVNVLFTVANRRGEFITHLGRDDFSVFEDEEIQNVSNFSIEAELPLNIAFLIDSSGSIRDKLGFERQAAARFFHSAVRRGKDHVLVMSFDTTATLLQDYTDNPALLTEAVQKIIPGGATSLYQAVFEAAAHRLAERPGRRIIIILSDGMDNSSHVPLGKTLEAAQKNDVIIYAVSTNGIDHSDPQDRKIGDAILKHLAEETGGRALCPTRMQDLAASFTRIMEELRSQYSLAYGPTNTLRDGTYRHIRIVASHRGYTIRSRDGYYAPDSGRSRSGGPS